MTDDASARYKRHRFPAEIIAHAVWLYYRFPLSLRDIEDLLAERGIAVSFQTVSEWTGLPHFVWRSDNWMGIIRALRSSAPARPYIARLIVFSRLI